MQYYICTYKLNVAYFIIPKAFWYSEPPCTTSTICHLETSLEMLSFRDACLRYWNRYLCRLLSRVLASAANDRDFMLLDSQNHRKI